MDELVKRWGGGVVGGIYLLRTALRRWPTGIQGHSVLE
jgi:hypothetical protein